MIISRFAPSPTGRLHLGHAYSAVLGHQRAHAGGGKFLLRIEDLDQTRSRPEFVGGIFIAIGLLTRPASLAAWVVLLVTAWFHWITLDQGYRGAEKSILWAAIFFYFVIRGGNRHSVDAKIGRAF